MPDYQKGKIYAIRAPGTDEVYIGSTTKMLSARLADHTSQFKNWKEGKQKYSSFKLLSKENYYIELVENFPCNSKEELNRREGEVQRTTANCVNEQIAGRTTTEYHFENKDIRNANSRDWYHRNRDAVNERKRANREENREKCTRMAQSYRERNREKYNTYQREYYAKKKAQASATECPPCSTHPSPVE